MIFINSKQQQRINQIIKDISAIEAGGNHSPLPMVWEKARGSYVWDIFGNKYIDFTSTIFVTNAGHDGVVRAVVDQARSLLHSYMYPTVIKYRYLRRLKRFLPKFCEKIYLASAGSEVTSWAINLMRAYKGKKVIVHIGGAFHGKTGSVSNLEKEEICLDFDTNVNTWHNAQEILNQKQDEIAGIMIESYQGWSAKFMDKFFIDNLCHWAKLHDVPVCFDEIQGGFWRTGKKFSYEWYTDAEGKPVEPDLICMGKGIGGGLPLSALSGRAKYFNVEGLSSTHSGNPLCCAAGYKALEIYEKMSEESLAKKTRMLQDTLSMFSKSFRPHIVEHHGHGLLASIIFDTVEKADKVCHLAMSNGLILVRTGKTSIKFGPPLTIPETDLVAGLVILEMTIKQVIMNV